MGTKIKNHFRAENWIKIKPKMWFNQVRIILFYIIQIKIKLNVKLKMPHVSDQYRRVIFEYIHQVVKIFYLYHVVSKLVEHFASFDPLMIFLLKYEHLYWSKTSGILGFTFNLILIEIDFTANEFCAELRARNQSKTRDRSEVSVNERYKYRIFVISNNEWVMPEGIKNWSITDLFKIFNFTQDLNYHVIWLQILIFVQNLKICESARDEIQRYWGLYELLSYPEERMNRIIGIGWPWTPRTNYYSLTILNLPGDMLTINWLGWKNKQPSTKWKYMTHHVTVWLI